MHRVLLMCAAATLFASTAQAQDAAKGEKTFALCRACHQIGPNAKNLIGPELNGIVGRKAGSVENYNYSDANKESGITWDEANLAEYIKDPRGKVPETKMTFAGIRDEGRVKDLIAFLKQYDATGKKN
jgi:cytochrome c